MKRKSWRTSGTDEWSTEGYWATYSDLMAGVLLVFALAAAWVRIDFQRKIVEPTKPLQQWQRLVSEMCTDPQLNTETTRVDCNTGRLIVSEESLRYETNSTDLSENGKALLLKVVPQYLNVARTYPDFDSQFESLEISGHTDSSGTVQINTEIGTQRAAKVLKFLLSAPELNRHAVLLRTRGFAAGYADTRDPEGIPVPIDRNDWPEARRIEIQLHLDEPGILRELKDLLDTMYEQYGKAPTAD